MNGPLEILRPQSEDDIAQAKALCEQYISWLDEDICFQGVDGELAGFPVLYAPPDGALRLAKIGVRSVGVVGLKRLDHGVCEMKRLFVTPESWGTGAGRALATAIIDDARELSYHTMRLDTLDRLRPAISLYLSLGFRECGPYNDNPLDGVRFFELSL